MLDLDQEIERRAGIAVREIFEVQGEAAFRELEHLSLKETARLEKVVVATGGGTMTFPRNRAVMSRLGVSVWLNPSFATIARRIGATQTGDRPLFKDQEQARTLYSSRLSAYARADLQIDVASRETASDVAARIALQLRERHCVT